MFLLACVLVLTLDQVSKAVALDAVAAGNTALAPVWARPFHSLLNSRVGVGAVRSRGLVAALLVGTTVSMLVVLYLAFPDDRVAQAALGTALGGASGNAMDRLRRGGVVDFIDLRVWPVFNLADLAIVCGVAVAAWRLL
jgi:signal peptidase II